LAVGFDALLAIKAGEVAQGRRIMEEVVAAPGQPLRSLLPPDPFAGASTRSSIFTISKNFLS
jgi:hypothetical protein